MEEYLREYRAQLVAGGYTTASLALNSLGGVTFLAGIICCAIVGYTNLGLM